MLDCSIRVFEHSEVVKAISLKYRVWNWSEDIQAVGRNRILNKVHTPIVASTKRNCNLNISVVLFSNHNRNTKSVCFQKSYF